MASSIWWGSSEMQQPGPCNKNKVNIINWATDPDLDSLGGPGSDFEKKRRFDTGSGTKTKFVPIELFDQHSFIYEQLCLSTISIEREKIKSLFFLNSALWEKQIERPKIFDDLFIIRCFLGKREQQWQGRHLLVQPVKPTT